MSYRYMPAAWDADLKALVAEQGWEDGERSVGAAALKLVLLCVTEHTNGESGEFWPKLETIADETGLDERTVRSALAKLERLGLIELVTPSTRWKPAVYRTLLQRSAGSRRAGKTPGLKDGGQIARSRSRVGETPGLAESEAGALPAQNDAQGGQDARSGPGGGDTPGLGVQGGRLAQHRVGDSPPDPGSDPEGGGGNIDLLGSSSSLDPDPDGPRIETAMCEEHGVEALASLHVAGQFYHRDPAHSFWVTEQSKPDPFSRVYLRS